MYDWMILDWMLAYFLYIYLSVFVLGVDIPAAWRLVCLLMICFVLSFALPVLSVSLSGAYSF